MVEEAAEDVVSNTLKRSRPKAPVKEQSPDESSASLSIKKSSPVRDVPADAKPTTADIIIPVKEVAEEKPKPAEKSTKVMEETAEETEISSTNELAERIQGILEKADIAALPDFIDLNQPSKGEETTVRTAPEEKPDEAKFSLKSRDRQPLLEESPTASTQLSKPSEAPVSVNEVEAQFEEPVTLGTSDSSADQNAATKFSLPQKKKPTVTEVTADDDQEVMFKVPSSKKQPEQVESPEAEFQLAPQQTEPIKPETDEEQSESLSLSRPRPKRRSLDEEMKEVQSAENSISLPSVQTAAPVEPLVEVVVFTKGIAERVAYEEEEDVEIVVITNTETSVQWMFGGELILASDKYTIFEDGVVHKLTIRRVTKAQAGRYTCKSETIETSGTIVVREKPVKFDEPLTDQTVLMGQDIVLTTKLTKKGSKVTWKKLRKTIKETTKYVITEDEETRTQTLTITNADLEDAGVYTCQVEDETTTCKVLVQAVPKFQSETVSRTVVLDAGQIFRCEIPYVGAPEPTVTMTHNNDKVSVTDCVTYRVEEKHVTVALKKVTTKDSGQYSVTIANELGEDTFDFEVTVVGESLHR